MRLSSRVTAGLLSGLLISTSYVPVFAGSHDVQSQRAATKNTAIICEPLSWDAANKLPSYIKASEVECMTPTQDDLQASVQARKLLETTVVDMQKHQPTSGSSTEIEYNDGMTAYAEGRYIAAIDHFRAAAPGTSR